MRALTVEPGRPGSLVVEDRSEPEPASGELLVQGIAMGVCGTDREIACGDYGWAPSGRDRLVLGHESLGRVLNAPADSALAVGDMVAGVVRRPDPEPCGACAAGEFDMCRTGRYRERGIKELDGYGAERWTVEADYVVPIEPSLGLCGVLMEPTSVVAEAWEQVERIGHRAWFEPRRRGPPSVQPRRADQHCPPPRRTSDAHVGPRMPTKAPTNERRATTSS